MKNVSKSELKKRLNQIEDIIKKTDELSNEEKQMLNTKISTIFDLHMRTAYKEDK